MDMTIRTTSCCIINRATTKYFEVLLIWLFSVEEITRAWSYLPKLCWLKKSTVSNEIYFVFVLCYSYRSRDEVQSVRKTRDPISGLREKLLDSGLADVDDIKVKKIVSSSVQHTALSDKEQRSKLQGFKTESIRKLSYFNFQWKQTLYQNNLNNITFFFTFLKGYNM